MLNCIQQHFTKGRGDIALFWFWKGSNFMVKLQQSICRSCVATSGKADPSRSRRKNLDAIIPARSFGRQSHHFSEDGPRKRFREVAEGPFPHGGDNISRCTFVGENDQSSMGPDQSKLAEQLDVSFSCRILTGKNQFERLCFDHGKCCRVVLCPLDLPIRQNGCDTGGERTVVSD